MARRDGSNEVLPTLDKAIGKIVCAIDVDVGWITKDRFSIVKKRVRNERD
jgi:hypothetical protein